jgi:hypothetical protein
MLGRYIYKIFSKTYEIRVIVIEDDIGVSPAIAGVKLILTLVEVPANCRVNICPDVTDIIKKFVHI